MGKKVKEYKSGDFIFAKVKGYPAWPARVQKLNGKKYFVYFYGTGETANLPANMIFDYAENKDKFLTKTVKRRDFNDGVKQIEHDFANNVPLEDVIGAGVVAPADTSANDTANDTTANETMDDSAVDTTAADETIAETPNTTAQNDTAVEDSDETGALVIDEGKQKAKKSKEPAKTPAKETPAKTAKTPRGKAKKEEVKEKEKEEEKDEEKKEEEIVSRSGRKIRPKRYIDEQTEENTTLPSPAPKKRRGGSPAADKEKEKEKEKDKPETPKEKPAEKNFKQYKSVQQSELEDLKEPFKSADADKENILIAYLPNGQYVGVKLFQSRPNSYKNEAARLQWDKQAAANAITLKMQLEKGHITAQSVLAQLVMDLNLTDEEKATLDKERETEEKKSRVQFLKTEMKLIELDAKIKTCLSLEKADTELCIKLLDELMELDVKPLMLLKHPTCLETVKRMRAYVGNAPSWDLSESAVILFSKQAHRIRKLADTLYKNMKDLFTTPEGLYFWEYFSERVLQFKKVTSKLNADELLEMVHEPLEMSVPTSHTMSAAIEAANEELPPTEEEEPVQKKKNTPAKPKKAATPSKPPLKRQSSRKQDKEDKEQKEKDAKITEENSEPAEETEKSDETPSTEKESNNEPETEIIKDKTEAETKENTTTENNTAETQEAMDAAETDSKTNEKLNDVEKEDTKEDESKKGKKAKESTRTDKSKGENKRAKSEEKRAKSEEKRAKSEEKSRKEDKAVKESEKEEKKEKEKEKEKEDEPRAKRSRGENKKTEPPPPRSPAAKRKSKF